MPEVKSQSIIHSVLIGFGLLCCSSLSGQYSPIFLTDSIKLELLNKTTFHLQQSHVQNLSTNRNEMAIFCKWELDLEDVTKLPVKFRLGSQEFVDKLEQKGPSTVKND